MNKITKFLLFSSVFLIPSYLIRFTVFGIPTNILEILIYLTFMSFLLEKPRIDWKEFYQNYKLCIFSIALIFFGLIISTLINKNYQVGFGIIKGWFFDPLLFSFILIQKIKNEEEVEDIFKIFYFSAFAISFIALGYFFLGKLTFDGRLAAFYASPNYMAMFLAPAVFIGIYLIKNYKFPLPPTPSPDGKSLPAGRQGRGEGSIKKIILFSFFIVIFVLYLTYSYATWIAIILSLLTVELLKIKKNNFKKIIIFIFISLALIVTQINNPKLKDFFSDRSSLNSRVMIWKSSMKILKDNFIFGIGPGNFQNKYLEYQKYFPPYLEWAVPEPHNLYLAFWLQSGIAGFIGFIVLVAIWLKQALKNSDNRLGAVFFGFMFYILIHGMADTPYWKNDLSFIFWVMFFLTLITSKINSVKLSVSSIDEK